MGNAESAVVRNVDKRTSRREHRGYFQVAVDRFRASPFSAPSQPRANATAAGRSLRVCIRKRPMFPHEREQGEFDVITCLPQRVVVHDARMHPNMVNMFMNHHDFVYDDALGETITNDEVYAGTAKDLVHEALRGNCGTVMMYGQTGSGKTYTMSAIYQRAANELFEHLDGRGVTVCFVELLGDNCFDMFNQGAPCTLSTAADGSVHPYPAVEVPVRDAGELLALIELAAKLRATAATGVHDQSSRSHAVCRIFIDCESHNSSYADVEGCLTLVDLAGSEHRIDNAEHNVERQKEGAKINASLAALKECIRATAAGAKFVAFRQNRLTQLLRGCFLGGDRHSTVVIATVSPSSKDTEHSLNTLRHACIMDGQGEAKGVSSAVGGGVCTKELLGEIDVSGIARDRRAKAKSQGGGPMKSEEWTKPPPAHQKKQSNTAARASLDARCVRALPQELGHALLEARQSFGTNRQRARLTRSVPVEEVEVPEVEEPSNPGWKRALLEDRARANSVGVQPTQSAPVASSRRATAPPESLDDVHGSRVDVAKAQELLQEVTRRYEDDSTPKGSTEHEKALELFRIFCTRGRDAHAWRKNDLRLINSCVVPLLYGRDVQLDWTHPNLALDELERLIGDMPPPAHQLTDPDAPTRTASASRCAPTEKVALRPPAMPGSGSAPNTGKRQSLAEEPPRAHSAARGRPTPEKEAEQARMRRDPRQPTAQQQNESLSSYRMRSESPASRGSTPDVVTPVTRQDAIRARREALEKARQQSLQKALSKNSVMSAMSGDDEIAHIEQQLAQKNCSAAAAVGLKKRLASLKAVAIREERKRKSAASAVQVDVSDFVAPVAAREEAPVPAHSNHRGQDSPSRGHSIQGGDERSDMYLAGLLHGGTDQRYSTPARGDPADEQRQAMEMLTAEMLAGASPQYAPSTPSGYTRGGDFWPEPAQPPPRNSTFRDGHGQSPLPDNRQRSNAYSPSAGDMYDAVAPSHFNSGCRRAPQAAPVGAAAAPWGNQFSNEVPPEVPA